MSERLWAGWRMEFIRRTAQARAAGTEDPCLFCGLAEQEPSAENLVLEKYPRCLLVLNAFPYTGGHVMVAPYRHHDSLAGADPEEPGEVQAALERARKALSTVYRPDGFNAGVNLGQAGGAGILGHIHWHLVPRWNGDTNFMPAVAATRVLPEALPETYRRLAEALEAEPPGALQVKGKRGG